MLTLYLGLRSWFGVARACTRMRCAAQAGYLRAQVEGAVERLLRMQLYGKEWDEVLAADPRKRVLTGAIWPHIDVASEGHVRTLGFIVFTQMQASRPIPTLPG
jgi:hypothetical protein